MKEEIVKRGDKGSKGGHKMEYKLWIFISIIYLFVFYLIIKTAVAKGIDDSKSIRELKKETKELKQHLLSDKRNKEDANRIINKRV